MNLVSFDHSIIDVWSYQELADRAVEIRLKLVDDNPNDADRKELEAELDVIERELGF